MKPIRETPRFYDFFPTRSTSPEGNPTRYTLFYTSTLESLRGDPLSIPLFEPRFHFQKRVLIFHEYTARRRVKMSRSIFGLSLFLSLSLSSRLYALLCNRIVSLMFALFITDYSSTVFRHRSGKIADRLAAYAFRYSVQSRIIERERER